MRLAVRSLGKGTYGTVDLVKDKSTDQLYALKRIRFQNTAQKDKALQEAELLSDCDHPNIGILALCPLPLPLQCS